MRLSDEEYEIRVSMELFKGKRPPISHKRPTPGERGMMRQMNEYHRPGHWLHDVVHDLDCPLMQYFGICNCEPIRFYEKIPENREVLIIGANGRLMMDLETSKK